ncbi:helix-turn-helix domain-containing protein [Gemella morbillorum]
MTEKNLVIDKKAVGLRIKQIRLNKGYTLEAFGKLFEARKGNVQQWENGISLPNKERIANICKVADVTVDELLYGKNDLNFDELFEKIITRPKEEIIDLITKLTIAVEVKEFYKKKEDKQNKQNKKITEYYTWNGEKYAEITEDDEENKSISVFSKLSKLKKLNDNQQLVLDTLKEEYGQEYIFDDIAHFADCYRYEKSNSEVSKAYLELNAQEEIEVLKEYIKHLEIKENEQC